MCGGWRPRGRDTHAELLAVPGLRHLRPDPPRDVRRRPRPRHRAPQHRLRALGDHHRRAAVRRHGRPRHGAAEVDVRGRGDEVELQGGVAREAEVGVGGLAGDHLVRQGAGHGGQAEAVGRHPGLVTGHIAQCRQVRKHCKYLQILLVLCNYFGKCWSIF